MLPLWILLKLYMRVFMGMCILIIFYFFILRFIGPSGVKIKDVNNLGGKYREIIIKLYKCVMEIIKIHTLYL